MAPRGLARGQKGTRRGALGRAGPWLGAPNVATASLQALPAIAPARPPASLSPPPGPTPLAVAPATAPTLRPWESFLLLLKPKIPPCLRMTIHFQKSTLFTLTRTLTHTHTHAHSPSRAHSHTLTRTHTHIPASGARGPGGGQWGWVWIPGPASTHASTRVHTLAPGHRVPAPPPWLSLATGSPPRG